MVKTEVDKEGDLISTAEEGSAAEDGPKVGVFKTTISDPFPSEGLVKTTKWQSLLQGVTTRSGKDSPRRLHF